MVYCGKPSKGCQNCRERKIACDQRVPGCRMCEKHNRTCPGYRNIVDLMFRDESEHVIWKAKKYKPRTSRRSSISPANGVRKKNSNLHQKRARSTASASVSPGATCTTPGSPVTESSPVSSSGTDIGLGARKYRGRLSPFDARSGSSEASLKSISILTPTSTEASYAFAPGSTVDYTSDEDDFLSLPSPDEDTWPTSPPSAEDYTLPAVSQEQGMAFFFSRYVVAAQKNVGHNNYDFIYDIWRPSCRHRDAQIDAVLASMTAVGLAAMSTLTCSPKRLDWARQSYVTALHLTNNALRDPREAAKDSTLLAVLILGTYEMLAGPGSDTMRAWQRHTRGAAALANMRGPGQFKTKAGVRMFLMLSETLSINCLYEHTPMPDSLVELRKVLAAVLTPLDTTLDISWRISSSFHKLLKVRSDIQGAQIKTTQDILDSLLAVDDEYVGLVAGIPDAWRYTVVRLERHNPAAFRQVCHIYPSLEKASTWNSLRTLRIWVHDTILSVLSQSFRRSRLDKVPVELKVQFARSRRLLDHLRDAILASVPQHFDIVSSRDVTGHSSDAQSGYFDSRSVFTAKDSPYRILSAPHSVSSPEPSASSTLSDSESSEGHTLPRPAPHPPALFDLFSAQPGPDVLFMCLASALHPLVWPLYLLGASSSCTADIRSYITERLAALHLETGLPQAKKVAEMVAAMATDGPVWGGICGVENMPDVSREPTPVWI